MKKIRQTIVANKHFTSVFIFLLLVASLFLYVYNDKAAFLLLNGVHNPQLDWFFSVYTFVGNGLFSLFVGAYLLVKRRFILARQVLAAYLLSGIIVQLVKNFVYAPRPKLVVESNLYHHFVEGVTLVGTSAFPSGHATSAFALATLFAFYAKNKLVSFLCLLAAVLGGYSRIYLGQHFLADVIMGALIGVVTAVTVNAYLAEDHWSFRFVKFPHRLRNKSFIK